MEAWNIWGWPCLEAEYWTRGTTGLFQSGNSIINIFHDALNEHIIHNNRIASDEKVSKSCKRKNFVAVKKCIRMKSLCPSPQRLFHPNSSTNIWSFKMVQGFYYWTFVCKTVISLKNLIQTLIFSLTSSTHFCPLMEHNLSIPYYFACPPWREKNG